MGRATSITGAECNNLKDRRTIRVSPKHQITIPKKFHECLGIGDEVECYLEKGAIVIRPISRDTGDFGVEILQDLMEQGYADEELLAKFKEKSRKVRQAIGTMLDEADAIATGEKQAASFEDVFGPESE